MELGNFQDYTITLIRDRLREVLLTYFISLDDYSTELERRKPGGWCVRRLNPLAYYPI